jgi:hypothetical protein
MSFCLRSVAKAARTRRALQLAGQRARHHPSPFDDKKGGGWKDTQGWKSVSAPSRPVSAVFLSALTTAALPMAIFAPAGYEGEGDSSQRVEQPG